MGDHMLMHMGQPMDFDGDVALRVQFRPLLLQSAQELLELILVLV